MLFFVLGVVLAGVGSLASLERLTGSISDKKRQELKQ